MYRYNLKVHDLTYKNTQLLGMDNLCSDVIFGQDLIKQHRSVEIDFGGPGPTLHVCGLSAMNMSPPSVLANLKSYCKPIAINSRHYTSADTTFFEEKTRKLLAELRCDRTRCFPLESPSACDQW